MSWLIIVVIAYFLIALQVILDKFLLSSEKISHPAIYAFYSGVMSIFAFAFFPFGFHLISSTQMILEIISGMIFVYGMLAMFFAIKISEASRVTPVVGAVVPIVTYILSVFTIKEKIDMEEGIGVLLLILGGLLIAYNFHKDRSRRFFSGFYASILAGVLLGAAFTFFKGFYEQDKPHFINVFIWTRFGLIAGAFSLLLVPGWRRRILNTLIHFKKPQSEHKKSGALFVLNKFLGGCGSYLINFSISLASVTVINALVSLEYVFIFFMGLGFSHWIPSVFQERRDTHSIFQKVMAIIIITFGIVLVAKAPLQ